MPASPQEVPTRLTDEQIRQKADAVQSAGERPIIADDYDARAVKFAQEMEGLSAEDQARLLDELLARDPGAMGSWLKLDILDRMQNEGRVSQGQYEAVANGFATAYSSGKISNEQLSNFLQIQSMADMAPGMRAQQYNQMLEFLNAGGNSDQMNQLREKFSSHLLESALKSNAAWNMHLPGLAMQIAAGSSDPSMPARVFDDVYHKALPPNATESQKAALREKLLDAIGQSSIGFRNSQGGDIPGLVNPMSVLIDSVAKQPDTKQWNELAVGIARYAETSRDDVFFDPYSDKPHGDTAQSLSRLLGGAQGTAILNDLNKWDNGGVPGKSGHAQKFGQNAIQMGNLLRMTAFNPDNPEAATAMKSVKEWTQIRKDYLNGVQRDDYPPGMSISQAREDLAMLGGASFDAVQQMKLDQDNRKAATEALVGFVIDMGLSAIPGGGKISSLVASDLKASFGNNETVNRLIDQALSQGDSLTDAQITQLKSDIAGALTNEQADLEALRTQASNFVSQSVLSGLSEGTQADGSQSHRDIIKGNIQNVQDDIQNNRQ